MGQHLYRTWYPCSLHSITPLYYHLATPLHYSIVAQSYFVPTIILYSIYSSSTDATQKKTKTRILHPGRHVRPSNRIARRSPPEPPAGVAVSLFIRWLYYIYRDIKPCLLSLHRMVYLWNRAPSRPIRAKCYGLARWVRGLFLRVLYNSTHLPLLQRQNSLKNSHHNMLTSPRMKCRSPLRR